MIYDAHFTLQLDGLGLVSLLTTYDLHIMFKNLPEQSSGN